MSGEILFLAHRLPWPPDRGDRIRSWHMLKALAELGPVHVVAPVDHPRDLVHKAEVEKIAVTVTTAVRTASKGSAMIGALMSGLPASVALFDVPRLRRHVAELLRHGSIGTVFAFSGQMAHYVPRSAKQRFIMDFVDMDSAKFAQQAESARGSLGWVLRREARLLKAFEIDVARRAGASLFVSDAEARLFEASTGFGAQVIENGVDADHFAPGQVLHAEAPHPLIVFTGQMDYAPNVEAVTQLTRDVLPLLPDAHFAIVGRAPTAEVKALAGERVTVTGEVPDTRPWLASADVVVAPLALARGIQNKVLEAMAMARAVVVSPGAGEGIDAIDGEHLIIAADAGAQAKAIQSLFDGPDRRERIGEAGRARVIERYGWQARLAPLAHLIEG